MNLEPISSEGSRGPPPNPLSSQRVVWMPVNRARVIYKPRRHREKDYAKRSVALCPKNSRVILTTLYRAEGYIRWWLSSAVCLLFESVRFPANDAHLSAVEFKVYGCFGQRNSFPSVAVIASGAGAVTQLWNLSSWFTRVHPADDDDDEWILFPISRQQESHAKFSSETTFNRKLSRD